MALCYPSQVSHYTRNVIFEDVRVKLFQPIDLFFRHIMSYMCYKCKKKKKKKERKQKKWESRNSSRFRDKKKLVHVIGHFRVPLCLCFKTSLSAKPLL